MIKICQSQWPSGLKFRPAVSGWDPRLLGLVSSSRCILDKPLAAVAAAMLHWQLARAATLK